MVIYFYNEKKIKIFHRILFISYPFRYHHIELVSDLGQFCKSVATSSEEGCPVLKNKVGSVPSNPSSSNSNGSPPHSSRPKRVVNVEPIEEVCIFFSLFLTCYAYLFDS